MDIELQDFSHPELNIQVTAIGGSYFIIKEARLRFGDKALLYLVGTAIFDTTCCGTGGCTYALVPGMIRKWRYKSDANGRPVSQVRPVSEERIRKKIRGMLFKNESVHQVNFM